MGALSDELTRAICALPGVQSGPSRFGGPGAGFHVDGKELAHFHSGTEIDVRVPRREQRAFRDDPRVTTRGGDWLVFRLRVREDVGACMQLVALAHADALRRAGHTEATGLTKRRSRSRRG